MLVLFGLALSFTTFVLIVVVARVSALFSSYFPFCFMFGLYVQRLGLGIGFRGQVQGLVLNFKFIAESVEYSTNVPPALPCCRNQEYFQHIQRARLPQVKCPKLESILSSTAVFPAFSSRQVTLGQMRKIGIHFIIYRFQKQFCSVYEKQIFRYPPKKFLTNKQTLLNKTNFVLQHTTEKGCSASKCSRIFNKNSIIFLNIFRKHAFNRRFCMRACFPFHMHVYPIFFTEFNSKTKHI